MQKERKLVTVIASTNQDIAREVRSASSIIFNLRNSFRDGYDLPSEETVVLLEKAMEHLDKIAD